jgi:hypothetical protein
MGARSSGSKPSAKDAALFAALLPEQSRIARGALVDDGGLRQAVSKAELELVGRSPTQTKTTLAAGVRAIGLAASRCEVAPATRRIHAVGQETGYRYATGLSVSGGGWRRRMDAPVSGTRWAC